MGSKSWWSHNWLILRAQKDSKNTQNSPQRGTSKKDLKERPQRETSKRDLKERPQRETSKRDLKERPQRETSNRLLTPMCKSILYETWDWLLPSFSKKNYPKKPQKDLKKTAKRPQKDLKKTFAPLCKSILDV